MKAKHEKVRKIEGFSPKKRLGQHFLRDGVAIKKIVGFLDLKPNNVVVEIGPGHGELTREIAKMVSRIIAIEKDEKMADVLGRLRLGNLEVVRGDALRLLPSLVTSYQLPVANYKIIGNIPYYITGQLLRILGEIKNPPILSVLAVQREVAERVSARPPRMNLLAAAVQIWADVLVVELIPRKSFVPPPKVDSAVIRLTPKKQRFGEREAKEYYKVVRAVFKQPRKTLWNNLREIVKDDQKLDSIFKKIGFTKSTRPQDLSVEEIKKIGSEVNQKSVIINIA